MAGVIVSTVPAAPPPHRIIAVRICLESRMSAVFSEGAWADHIVAKFADQNNKIARRNLSLLISALLLSTISTCTATRGYPTIAGCTGQVDYSALSAAIGSADAARRAGKKAANRATSAKIKGTRINVSGS